MDDEGEIRRVLSEFFTKKGFETVAVESGSMGLNLLANEDFDCLISDIRMPYMDGVELTRKARDLNPGLVIILLTGFGSLETAQEAIKTGIQGYLTKPIDLEKLYATVAENLERAAAGKKEASRYRKLEEEIKKDKERLDSMKADLTSLINHELRTPVAVISESLSLLKDAVTPFSEEKVKTFSDIDKQHLFDFLERGHRRLVTVIEDIGYYMNLKNKVTRLNTSEVVLNDFLETSFAGFQRLIAGSNQTIKKEFTDEKLNVEIDKEKFLDMLARIINNAARHNPDGVDIAIRLSAARAAAKDGRETDFAKIEISDNGRGLAEEGLEDIFKPFSVGDLSTHAKGIGVGLAISKEVIDLHRGVISINNQKGAGAVVTIEIPRSLKGGK